MENKQTYSNVEKKEKIYIEIERLRKLFENMPESKKQTAESLILNVAFTTVTLNDLQDALNENGVISHYQNGANQWGTKKSPESDIYNAMIKNHMAMIKQLIDLLPEGETENKKDSLMEFLYT
jgi:cysteinyl-tRNA synthetase